MTGVMPGKDDRRQGTALERDAGLTPVNGEREGAGSGGESLRPG